MSKKNSILFQISVFFIIVIITINGLVVTQLIIDNEANEIIQMKRYFHSFESIKDGEFNNLSKDEINKKLKPFNTKLSNISINLLKKKAKLINTTDDTPVNIFIYKEKKYINPKPPKFFKHPFEGKPPKPPRLFYNEYEEKKKLFDLNTSKKQFFDNRPPKPFFEDKQLVIEDIQDKPLKKSFWLIILFVTNILLIWFYYFIYNKLLPLLNLKNEIVKFSQGDLDIDTKSKGKDEISQVANEFNNAILQLKELRKTKNLFLRNIMHELKTPITKGKLITDNLENNRKKDILRKAFLRLEFLLEEFAKLDKITNGKMQLNKKEYRFIDILDQAIDMLIFDSTRLDIQSEDVKICVDFEIFAIAIKNLLDNSIKYNTNGDPIIRITKNSFIISNKGKPLKKPFKEYLTPFNREYESIDKGLGLGLYITNGIIKNHQFEFDYKYEKGFHNFIILF